MRVFAQFSTREWILLDGAIGVLSAYWALHSNPYTLERFGEQGSLMLSFIAAGVVVLSSIAMNFYSSAALRNWGHFLSSIAGAAVAGTIGLVAAGYFLFYAVPGRLVALAFFLLIVMGLLLPRLPFLFLRQLLQTRIFFIGTQEECNILKTQIQGPHSYALVEFWDVTKHVVDDKTSEQLQRVCVEHLVDAIVVSSRKNQIAAWFDIVLSGVRHGCRLRALPDFIEDEAKEVPVDLIDSAWLLGGDLDVKNHLGEAIKRLMDITVGIVGLVVCLPIFIVLATVIKLTTHGPVFYSQVRVGRFGKTFNILKFRTMNVDAEKGGAQWAKVSDPRVTWYGGLLRKSRLDETPQFLNIVMGHMSFVGPRPERPQFVSELDKSIPYYGCRHLVRPGLTGWAQILYRYGASVEDAKRKLQFDLYYVRHQSPSFDLYIILRTFLAIAKGAR